MLFKQILTVLVFCGYLSDIQKLIDTNYINRLMTLYLSNVKTNLACSVSNEDLVKDLAKLSAQVREVSADYKCGNPQVTVKATLKINDRSIELNFGKAKMGGYFEYDFSKWHKGFLIGAFSYYMAPKKPITTNDMVVIASCGLGINPDAVAFPDTKVNEVKNTEAIVNLFDKQATSYMNLKSAAIPDKSRLYYARCGYEVRAVIATEETLKGFATDGYDAHDSVRLKYFLPKFLELESRIKDPFAYKFSIDLVPGKKHNHKIDEYSFLIKRKQKVKPETKYAISIDFKWAAVKISSIEGAAIGALFNSEAEIEAWTDYFAATYYVPTSYKCVVDANKKDILCTNKNP